MDREGGFSGLKASTKAYLDPPGVHFSAACLKSNMLCCLLQKRDFSFQRCCFKILPERGRQMSLFGRGMSPLGRAKSPFRLHPGFAKPQNSQKCTLAKKCVVCTKRRLWPKQQNIEHLEAPRYILKNMEDSHQPAPPKELAIGTQTWLKQDPHKWTNGQFLEGAGRRICPCFKGNH